MVAANWWLSTWSVVNLVRLQVYHTERPPYFLQHFLCSAAARRVGLSATADACWVMPVVVVQCKCWLDWCLDTLSGESTGRIWSWEISRWVYGSVEIGCQWCAVWEGLYVCVRCMYVSNACCSPCQFAWMRHVRFIDDCVLMKPWVRCYTLTDCSSESDSTCFLLTVSDAGYWSSNSGSWCICCCNGVFVWRREWSSPVCWSCCMRQHHCGSNPPGMDRA